MDEGLDDTELLEEEVEIIEANELEEVLEEEAPLGEGLGAEEGEPAEDEFTEEVEVLDENTVAEVVAEKPDDTEFLDEEVEILEADELEGGDPRSRRIGGSACGRGSPWRRAGRGRRRTGRG
ncbi:MAG: hypothetical protein NT087_10905 [Deltaproteobacteria bacterium]|nr:hypothetical protein [Deltaproteobacteria bacterium]